MKDIKKVISSYKQRFISTSPRSKTYFLSVLDDKSVLDLYSFHKQFGVDETFIEELLQKKEIIFRKKKVDLNLVKKLLQALNEFSKRKVKEYIPMFTNKDFLELEEMNKVQTLLRQELDSLEALNDLSKKSYIKGQLTKQTKEINEHILSLIEKYTWKVNKDFSRIERMEHKAMTMLKDFGKNDLYLGFPFIEGKFQTGKHFRAPLILHRVLVKRVTNKTTIKIIEQESMINPVFLISYHIENNLPHQTFDWGLQGKDYLKEAYDLLDQFKISYQSMPKTVSKFSSMTRKEFISKNLYDFNQFEVKNNAVLGLFPISDKNIYDDLASMEIADYQESDSITTFIKGIDNLDDIFVKQTETRAKESEIKYITALDYSQKNVVKESMKHNLVIEGPPGTGKSQVLSNIVANYVEQGKKVLVVSEKLAALEVVYNRIGNLSQNALLIRNHVTDKDSFYKQLKSAITQITKEGSKDTYRPFKEINDDTEALFHKLEKRAEDYKKTYGGFTQEQVLRYHASSQKEIKQFKKIINKKLKSNNNLDTQSQLTARIESIYQKGIHKTAKDLVEFSSNTPALKITEIKKYTSYLMKFQSHEVYARDLLFYAIMHGISTDQIHNTIDSRFHDLKTFDIVKEAMQTYIDSGSVMRYQAHAAEIDNVAYQYLGITDQTVQFIHDYKKYSLKERVTFIKRIQKPKFKLSFFKSFRPKKALNKQEKIVFEYLEKEFVFRKPELVITNGLTEDRKQIMDIIINNPALSKDELVICVFNQGIYTLDLGRQKRTINAVHKYYSNLKKDTLESVMKHSKVMMDLAIALELDGLKTKEASINALNKHLVRKEYRKLQKEIQFYNSFAEKYSTVIQNLEDKMYKSRISIENNIKRDISVKGQTDTSFAKAIAELRRISDLKRKKSIAVTTKRFTHELLELFPICLMTPGSVSATLKNDKNLFDVVIFDEASQMFVEHAVPSINRSKKIIVAGDSKQLKPSSIFSQRFIEGDELFDEDYSFDVIAALDEESLLDYCKHKYKSIDLRYHYRSDHKELIEFSSRAFYDSKLVFSSNIVNQEEKPIEVIDVPGKWLYNSNKIEALEVVRLVKHVLETRVHDETIGVITFNSKQMDLIQDLLEEESQKDRRITSELTRTHPETHADESLFVKNIENVQGDERDIIIFSVAYGMNRKGKFNNIFGSLSQPGGENRLNVAITRAKKKVYIVKSIDSSVLSVNEENKGNYFFKKYLQYTERINQNEDVTAFLDGLSEVTMKTERNNRFDTPFEEEVFMHLNHSLGEQFEVRNQIRVGSFNIDIAVYDIVNKRYVLGIECDNASYYGSFDAVERDIYRQTFLESRGWNVHKLWGTSWWNNKKKETKKIIDIIQNNL